MSEAAQNRAVHGRKERRITSPEQLHDYIHVTNPNLWILLVMIIAMLAGMIVLAATITIENKLEVQAEVSGFTNEAGAALGLCSITGDQRNQVRIGMKVRIAGEEGTITEMIEDEQEVFASFELDRADAKLKEGVYDATIVLETTTPLSFLLERK